MNERIEQIIGANVQRLRQEQGHTKTAFCLMAGISRPYLDKVEAGEANITVRQLERLASGLGVEPVDLIS